MSFIGGRPAGYLSPGEIYALAVKHGFQPGQEAATAAAIAQQESSGIVNNFNPDDPHGGSVGLMQINGANAHLIGGDNWKSAGTDPDASMEAAHALYANRGNFNDWGSYTSGAYKKYYNGGTTLNSSPVTPPHTLTPSTAGAPYTAANPSPRPSSPRTSATGSRRRRPGRRRPRTRTATRCRARARSRRSPPRSPSRRARFRSRRSAAVWAGAGSDGADGGPRGATVRLGPGGDREALVMDIGALRIRGGTADGDDPQHGGILWLTRTTRFCRST